MLSRREFHKSVAGLALASVVSGPQRAMAASDGGLTDAAFLNRLTFGASPEALTELARLGRAEWLERQLQMPATDAGLAGRFATAELWIEYGEGKNENGGSWEAVAEARALSWLDKPAEELIKLLDWDLPLDYAERVRPFGEVIAASYIRAVHAPAQLREVMTQFWHEHFSVFGDKDEITATLFPVYDADLRENALGNFRILLGKVAKSPVMLHYLNNDNSSASPANENYARELLELHTLGQENYFNDLYDDWRDVPGAEQGMATGYIDDDVYEVARALTGWSIGDGRDTGNEANTPVTGRFAYVEAWHDPYQKRFLGHELPAFSGPMEDGETVLDILAAHPGTAHFVTGKILRRLGIENPSKAYHDEIAKTFNAARDKPDQIAGTIRAIVEHPEFLTTPPSKLRRPFEYLAAIYRATGAKVSPRGEEIDWQLSAAGWSQHRVRPPTGHSDKTEDWADTRTINGMIELILHSHREWVRMTDRELDYLPAGVTTFGQMAQYWADRFGVSVEDILPALAVLDADSEEALPSEAEDIVWVNEFLVTSAALGPEFLFR